MTGMQYILPPGGGQDRGSLLEELNLIYKQWCAVTKKLRLVKLTVNILFCVLFFILSVCCASIFADVCRGLNQWTDFGDKW